MHHDSQAGQTMNIKSNDHDLHKMKRQYVNMCEIVVSSEDEIIETPPLGSCIAVILYAPQKCTGGLAHCLLPKAPDGWKPQNSDIGKFVDQSIIHLLERLSKLGIHQNEIIAKLVGGAKIINFEEDADSINIGHRNVEQAISQLIFLGIPIQCQDVGGSNGRTVEFYINSGDVYISGYKFKRKII